MSINKVVVIGTSVGGMNALQRLLGRLPPDFPAAVLVVMHIGSHYSVLPMILKRGVGMPLRHAEDNESVQPGTVLIAPPDHHMLVEDGLIRLSHGAKENFARPAIDPLFRCAAVYYRENAIGVILTGVLDDGTIGLQAVKAYGGVALVQDPDEADEPEMPRSALQYVPVDDCMPLDGLAQRLIELTAPENTAQRPEPMAAAEWDRTEVQSHFALRQRTDIDILGRIATPAGIACPECHGGLWQVNGVSPLQFRCHTGHSYTEQTLFNGQESAIEEAMWAALRALHEKQMLLKRLAASAKQTGREHAAEEHEASARALANYAETLRSILTGRQRK
ncbi:two-component system, chemotaxis family, response regulator CheB [Noviherbaspirillum humi]|uniref:protein-glutamate methylesterase n=1 Tax=Noviherbaspirillum humi TaxID=1688639 RepID=A0A239IHM3_9BURK|nr:chemotaxis protein CheB [Noviherbaspirillum humi]SNS93107.1 two-component system, chemotaxis family, response regulator CheB [Noviherbaspirillum humi]